MDSGSLSFLLSLPCGSEACWAWCQSAFLTALSELQLFSRNIGCFLQDLSSKAPVPLQLSSSIPDDGSLLLYHVPPSPLLSHHSLCLSPAPQRRTRRLTYLVPKPQPSTGNFYMNRQISCRQQVPYRPFQWCAQWLALHDEWINLSLISGFY